MKEDSANLSNYGGIYAILNVLECKVYVGQSGKINNRDHNSDLQNGIDSSDELQKDYYNVEKEFVFFIVFSDEKNIEKEKLNAYEQLYIKIFEKLGFETYNEIKSIKIPNIVKHEYESEEEALRQKFVNRFGVEPKQMIQASFDKRKDYLEYYVRLRWNHKDKEQQGMIQSDRFFYNRKRICNIIGTREKSILSLDINEMFFSKAGSYIGEGIDQILSYEMESIKNHKYCLWTVAPNAVNIDTVRSCCVERQKNNIDTYVLFKFTPSSAYASAESNRHSLFRKKYVQKLSKEEMNFLNFDAGSYGHYYVPEDIDCTAANDKSAEAFVIQEFFLIKECIREDDNLYENYKAVNSKNEGYSIKKGGYQRSAFYLRANDDKTNLENVFYTPKHRELCFVGKLAAPYVIRLEKEPQ